MCALQFLYAKVLNLAPPWIKSLTEAIARAASPARIAQLSKPPSGTRTRNSPPAIPSTLSPRFCYSYFALYGDPLLNTEIDPYPDGYLARLAEAGVDGVWLQAVLYKLAPFPWDIGYSSHYQCMGHDGDQGKDHTGTGG